MKYVAFLEFGVAGCRGTELIEAESKEEAEGVARELTLEWASSFGYEQDYDHFGDLDTLGCEWLDEEEEYAQEGFIDSFVEEYNPEKHDGIL
jgi:hypothetical protein